jgi:hypothetical protein
MATQMTVPAWFTWGWAIALIVLIVTIIMTFMKMVDLPVALLIAAVCSHRL